MTRIVYHALACALFLILSSSSPLAGVLLPYISGGAVLLVTLAGKTTNTLTACLVSALSLCVLQAWPQLAYLLNSCVTAVVCVGNGAASVSPSSFVPPAALAVAIAWLLASTRKGTMAFLGLLLAVVTVTVAFGLLPDLGFTDLDGIGQLLFVARLMFTTVAAGGFAWFLIRETSQPSLRQVYSGPLSWAWAALALLLVGSSIFTGAPTDRSAPNGRRVLLWYPPPTNRAAGASTQSAEACMTYGRLFSELPSLLQRSGFDAQLTSELNAEHTAGAGVICMLSPFRSLRAAEKRFLHAFVTRGGRLLVAAEHTDMDGNRSIYNDLLMPYGVSINFDTVTSLAGNLVTGTHTSAQPLGHLFRRYPNLAYNRGASIEVHGAGAIPVLVADFWHSDAGDEGNPDKALMGDESWSSGDRIGNIILVACSGGAIPSVTVFGDTSPFINTNVHHNAAFICDLFWFLLGSPSYQGRRDWHVMGAGIAALALLGVLASLAAARGHSGGRMLAVASAVLLCLTWACIGAHPPSRCRSAADASRVLVSTEEQNLFSRDPFSPESVTAIGTVASGMGLPTFVGPWRDADPGDTVFIINPTRKLNFDRLLSHVRNGGTAVVSGTGEHSAFGDTVRHTGCTLGSVPFGRIEGTEMNSWSAWEVVLPRNHPDSMPILVNGLCIGVRERIGKGMLVVLADSGFFQSRNLETSAGEDERNVGFLQTLLRR